MPISSVVSVRIGFAFFLLVSVAGFAQNEPAPNSPPATPTPDQQWSSLLALITRTQPQGKSATPRTSETRAAARQDLAGKFLEVADAAKAFRLDNPGHPKAPEARVLEVNGLMGAVNLGDAKIEDRLDLAVGELRADQTLPRDLRARVVGGYSFSRVVRKSRSPAERTAATEQTARDLIREFPSEPQGYESLLNVALESDDEKYRNLLFFLWQSSAPTVVKLRVRTRMDRHFLKGEKISELLADAGEEKLAKNLTPGRPTILYAWSAGNAASMAIEEALKLRALAQANVIGICLDRDIPAARAAAQPAHLPGTLYYDEHGSGGKLATRLKIDGAPALILVGADGRIVDTRGEYAFAAKVTQLGL